MSTDNPYVYGERWPADPSALGYMGAQHWAAVSAAIGSDHNPESCALCHPPDAVKVMTAAGAVVNYTSQPIEAPLMQFPRDPHAYERVTRRPEIRAAINAEIERIARADAERREAELRAKLVAKVREEMAAVAWDDDGELDLYAMAEAAVDVITDTIRKGEL